MSKRHMDLKDREKLQSMYNEGKSAEKIAAELKVHRSTVYNELHRGETGRMDSNGRMGYSAMIAQEKVYLRYKNRKRPTAGRMLGTGSE